MIRAIAVVGPTATGKSDLGVALAERLGGEVVNADAMQLYLGMDIGTAKITPTERRGVPHHLLDVLTVTETASVAAYQRAARAVIEDILARDRVPVLVGGSGLYVQAVVDELEFPGTDPDIRARLEAELTAVGSAPLYARLAELDPVAAESVLPSNGRRIVRALEVIELTGRPFSATMPKPGPARYDMAMIGLDRDPTALDTRVDHRVELMFAQGLVDEVRALEAQGLRDGKTAARALGYQQVLTALDTTRGDLRLPSDPVFDRDGNTVLDRTGGPSRNANLDRTGDPSGKTALGRAGDLSGQEACDRSDDLAFAEAAADTARATRRFVRRQRSWFRRDPRITWLDAARPDLVDAALAQAATATKT
ncbi:tRNA (adenosine(37)-N6)-dimethylallyltransferase MiaA [Actinokineospora terrae]|uniref:tRNA dimethylallyltransferase n=1 Tax=Actinokineospora terrae TaxID=155974 RepID=A0A1H9XSB7_9PSEU|nr:tRNA (adenosine(37)-N6)-dimethylallyltransferase MiaA [Actinokineospora terrae]SES48627.1 tRNA dimethylallyltransferase [Actinokineospora terrae]